MEIKKECVICKKIIYVLSPRAKYCMKCNKEVIRERAKKYQKKYQKEKRALSR